MFARFAGFEIRYQLVSPLFIITALAFFVVSFVMSAVPEATAALSGSANINSPFIVGLLTLLALVSNLAMLPYPTWFKAANLLVIPLALIAGTRLASRPKTATTNVAPMK